MRLTALLAPLMLLLPLAAQADSMRCGKRVVNEQSSPAEIREKCGEPQQKDVEVTERWRYQRSSSTLPMLVTGVDGKVVSLERTQ